MIAFPTEKFDVERGTATAFVSPTASFSALVVASDPTHHPNNELSLRDALLHVDKLRRIEFMVVDNDTAGLTEICDPPSGRREIEIDKFQDFRDKSAVRMSADFMVRQGLYGGAWAFGVSREGAATLRIRIVDDWLG